MISPVTRIRRRPEQICQPAPQQQEAAIGEDVAVDDPLQALLTEAEVVLDRRQGDVQDRGVEDVHELDEAEQERGWRRRAATKATTPPALHLWGSRAFGSWRS